MIQTVDSAKLARRLDEIRARARCDARGKALGGEAKSGADPAGLAALIAAVSGLPESDVPGLMTMPPWSDDPEASRAVLPQAARTGRAARTDANSRWGCRTIWRRPSKKARRACAWARRCSANG